MTRHGLKFATGKLRLARSHKIKVNLLIRAPLLFFFYF